jgi:hypothetical protein
MATATGVLIVAGPEAPLEESWGFRGFAAVLAVAFGAVGVLISLRVPGHRIGWLLIAIGLSAALVGFSVEYAAYGLAVRPGSLPGALVFGWLVSWAWVPFASLCSIFLPLFFPDGQLPSPRWRPVALFGVLAVILVSGSLAVLPGPIDNAPYLDNPLGLPAERYDDILAVSYVGFLLLCAAILLSTAALVLRFRRSRGVERQQMKWLAAAAVFAALTLAGPGVLVNIVVTGQPRNSTIKATEILTILSLATIPMATGIAILRYRLYDIDRVLSRTIAWGLVSAVLIGLFVAIVLALQGLLAPVTGGDTLAVAASTLLVAGLAQPIARRVQAAVDRRFFRARYDAGRAADNLAQRLRAEVDLDAIRRDVAGTVIDTMHPMATSLWIRRAGG